MLIISFPHNPTTMVVDLSFFEHLVDFAKEHRLMVVHDFAYGDIVFDGYRAPSFLQAKGAKDVGVEFFSLSKSYNMPGWRVGFGVGNASMLAALARLKSYFDYGVFQPVQIASIIALNEDQRCVHETAEIYRRRRDTLVHGLKRIDGRSRSPRDHVRLRDSEAFKKWGLWNSQSCSCRKGRLGLSLESGSASTGGICEVCPG
jgi:alanine-synthesizing transaminase